MNKEEIGNISQLLSSMKDLSKKLEEAVKNKDMKKASDAKKELLTIQGQIDRIL